MRRIHTKWRFFVFMEAFDFEMVLIYGNSQIVLPSHNHSNTIFSSYQILVYLNKFRVFIELVVSTKVVKHIEIELKDIFQFE